jgi:DNA primase catalytic core
MSLSAERVLELNDLAASFYEAALATSAGQAARAYISARGLTPATVARWRLGYAPAAGSALATHLAKAGWGEAALLEAGLARSGPRGSSDFFYDRLMLPILAEDGRVLAFGSRRLRDEDTKAPKYLNSPDIITFHKREILYGLPNLSDALKVGEAYLVEGNLDMLTLWQHGIANVLATCGTALSAEHLALLAARIKRVTLVLDADRAGAEAVARGLIIEGAGRLDLGVVEIVGAKDPDELLTKAGRPAWDACVARRIGRWDWLYADLARAEPGDELEARLERKNAWAALIGSQVSETTLASNLFARAEADLGLPAGMLMAEYGGELVSDLGSTDELTLVALAADWEQRSTYLPYLELGANARALVARWQKDGSPSLSATLRHRAQSEAVEVEQLWRITLRRRVLPLLQAQLAQAALSDPARETALRGLIIAAGV